jgi:uncharacterized membrane protein
MGLVAAWAGIGGVVAAPLVVMQYRENRRSRSPVLAALDAARIGGWLGVVWPQTLVAVLMTLPAAPRPRDLFADWWAP